MTKEQEYMTVYEHLLAMVKEIELDPSLAQFSKSVYRDVADFEENYPEIVSEYSFTKQQGD